MNCLVENLLSIINPVGHDSKLHMSQNLAALEELALDYLTTRVLRT